MTQPALPPPAPEISALIAWMRRLSNAGARHADPAELAAFCHTKHDLIARIQHCGHQPATRTSQETPVD